MTTPLNCSGSFKASVATAPRALAPPPATQEGTALPVELAPAPQDNALARPPATQEGAALPVELAPAPQDTALAASPAQDTVMLSQPMVTPESPEKTKNKVKNAIMNIGGWALSGAVFDGAWTYFGIDKAIVEKAAKDVTGEAADAAKNTFRRNAALKSAGRGALIGAAVAIPFWLYGQYKAKQKNA